MTRPTPQFRPRRAKQPAATKRTRWYLAGAAVLLVAALAGVLTLIFRAGGDDDLAVPGVTAGQSTGGTAGGPETLVQGPAFAYVIQTGDLGAEFTTNNPETYRLSALAVATAYYANVRDGETELEGWGFRDGYQASVRPQGQAADLVRGSYYALTETLVFDTVEGARKAYAYIQSHNASVTGSEPQQGALLANESAAWKFVQGTIPGSELPAVYHRFVFRRGSMISTVQAFGASQYVTADQARDLAVIVDDKALGKRPAPTPTPPANATLARPPAATPTPTR